MGEVAGWAIVELMGHRVRYGYVRSAEVFGTSMLQIDIPVAKDEVGQDIVQTEHYGGAAIYAVKWASEEMVRDELARFGEDLRQVRPAQYRDAATAIAGMLGPPEDMTGSDF